MTDYVPINHIVRKQSTGKPRVAGHGITVQFLSLFINDPNWTVEKICEHYGLTPAQVHAAWAFYYDHKEEIDHSIEQDRIGYERLSNDPEYLARIAALEEKKRKREERNSSQKL